MTTMAKEKNCQENQEDKLRSRSWQNWVAKIDSVRVGKIEQAVGWHVVTQAIRPLFGHQ